MSAIGSQREYDLGAWGYRSGKEWKQVNFKLFEETKLSYYLINSQTGKVEDTEYELPGEKQIVEAALKTKKLPFLPLVLFLPPRTDYLDFFIPLTRRISSTVEGPTAVKIVKRVLSVTADILTLIFRLFTFLPMLGFNKYKEHPLKSVVGPVEAILVKSEITWELVGPSEDFHRKCTGIYHWPLFLGDSPLLAMIEWNEIFYETEEQLCIKQPDGSFKQSKNWIPNVISDKKNLGSVTEFCYGKQEEMYTPQDFWQKFISEGKEYTRELYYQLETLVVSPRVVYL